MLANYSVWLTFVTDEKLKVVFTVKFSFLFLFFKEEDEKEEEKDSHSKHLAPKA